VIDIYPGIKEKELAIFSARFTVLLDGSIYYEGRKWTPELMRIEWQRVQDMQDAFDVALSVVEAERAPKEVKNELL